MPIEQLKIKPEHADAETASRYAQTPPPERYPSSHLKSPKNIQRFSEEHTAMHHHKEPEKEDTMSKKRKRKISWGVLISQIALSCLAVGSVIGLGAYVYFAQGLPDINDLFTRSIAESTKIYDRTGQHLLYEIHGEEKRTSVSMDEINPFIVWATISAEDKKFYSHKGFSVTGIIRSVLVDVFLHKKQGGSTITQQLVKNAILTTEQTYSRKIKELILARRVERANTKDEILTMYFNEIPYGSVVYGIEAASQYYFGTSAKDVTLAQSAILAALPKGPTKYSPYGSHKDLLIGRQQWILDEMAADGYISRGDADAAKGQDLAFINHAEDDKGGITAPHFVMFIREYLSEKYGELLAQQGGLTVITTLDMEKQKIAEDVIADSADNLTAYGASNAALVSVDTATGEILSMVGSRDFFNTDIDGQVNVVIRPRQPGSSIKPVVYATAFEKGYTPETIIYDTETVFPTATGPYTPHNYSLKENGPVTMRKALQGSLNIAAVKTLYLAGIDAVKQKLINLGYGTITMDSPCGLSLVLGGCEVRLLDHVGAFATFARDGEKTSITGVLEIKDRKGGTLEKYSQQTARVYSKATARSINSVLSDNDARAYIFGANSALTLGDRPAAVKTGTTNDYKDAWTIGFTPSVITGVWVGNNDSTSMKQGADGSYLAAPIWKKYMQTVLADTSIESFKAAPEIDQNLKPILRGVSTPEYEVEIDKASGKLATALTPETYRQKKKFKEVHDILHYVVVSDPLGPPPSNPTADPMYLAWEQGVQQWIPKKVADDKKKAAEEGLIDFVSEWESVNQAPPSEFDDVHTEANRPQLTLNTPSNNQLITINPVLFAVTVFAPRGISRVEYILGGKVIGVSYQPPYDLTSTLIDFGPGYYPLDVTAYDDIDNAQKQHIELNLNLPQADLTVSFINPRNNASFYRNNFPLTFDFSLNRINDIANIRLIAQGNGQEYLIGEAAAPADPMISLRWDAPPPAGTYTLAISATGMNGSLITIPGITISILP